MPETNVERQLGILIGKLDAFEKRFDRADDSRGKLHGQLDDVVIRMTHIESDVNSLKGKIDSVEEKVEAVEKVTDDVKKMRERAFGAGTAGVWLLRIGSAVLSFAAGLAAAYTWLTGRPPP